MTSPHNQWRRTSLDWIARRLACGGIAIGLGFAWAAVAIELDTGAAPFYDPESAFSTHRFAEAHFNAPIYLAFHGQSHRRPWIHKWQIDAQLRLDPRLDPPDRVVRDRDVSLVTRPRRANWTGYHLFQRFEAVGVGWPTPFLTHVRAIDPLSDPLVPVPRSVALRPIGLACLFLVGAVGSVAVLAVRRRTSALWRGTRGLCVTCGYPTLGGTCPECGRGRETGEQEVVGKTRGRVPLAVRVIRDGICLVGLMLIVGSIELDARVPTAWRPMSQGEVESRIGPHLRRGHESHPGVRAIGKEALGWTADRLYVALDTAAFGASGSEWASPPWARSDQGVAQFELVAVGFPFRFASWARQLPNGGPDVNVKSRSLCVRWRMLVLTVVATGAIWNGLVALARARKPHRSR